MAENQQCKQCLNGMCESCDRDIDRMAKEESEEYKTCSAEPTLLIGNMLPCEFAQRVSYTDGYRIGYQAGIRKALKGVKVMKRNIITAFLIFIVVGLATTGLVFLILVYSGYQLVR
jgi:hypothetical protein